MEGGYEFECQHGPAECYGNQVQACAIALAPDYDTTVRWDTRHVTRGIMMESPLQTDSVHDEQLRPQHRRAGVLPGVRPRLSTNPGASQDGDRDRVTHCQS